VYRVIREKACLTNLNFFKDSIKTFLEKTRVKEEVILEIILASEEILVNVMSYAYPKDQKGYIGLICAFLENGDNKKIKFTFIDDGKFFDIVKKETPNLNTPIGTSRKIGELGIHLVKAYMDSVSYIRKNNRILSL